MPIEINVEEAFKHVEMALKAKKVPMLHGSPGLAKSAIMKQIAERWNLKLLDYRLSTREPSDLGGFPGLDTERGLAKYFPLDTFPLEDAELPVNPKTGKQYAGWLLFLDEITSCPPMMQAAAYQLVLDHMVGMHNLHKRVAIAAAGNLIGDGAVVIKQSTALQTRFIHYILRADHMAWLKWAANNGVDERVRAYVAFSPDSIHSFDPKHDDLTYSCPRSLEFLSDVLKANQIANVNFDLLPTVAGTIGEGEARQFIGFCEVYKDLVTFDEIMADPENLPISNEPSVNHAIAMMIASNVNDTNFDHCMKYIERMGIEFQVVCMQSAYAKTPAIKTTQEYRRWVSRNAQRLA